MASFIAKMKRGDNKKIICNNLDCVILYVPFGAILTAYIDLIAFMLRKKLKKLLLITNG